MSYIRKSKASRKYVDNLESKGWIILSKVKPCFLTEKQV